MQLNRFYDVKLHVFKSLGERNYNSDNKNIYHSKFAWYVKRSSMADINSKSYHLIALELVYVPSILVSFWSLLIIESVAHVSQHLLFMHELLVKQVSR